MKRFLLFCMVVGLLAGQASASMYTLDAPLARQFVELPAPGSAPNYLNYVIDSPGTVGSTTYYNDLVYGASPDYGETMQLAVGFLGSSQVNNTITIGTTNIPIVPGGAYDSFGAAVANDNDDPWDVQLFVSYDNLVNTTGSGWTTLSGYSPLTGPTVTFLSMANVNWGSLTHLGFEVTGSRSVDIFHLSVVPIPGAVILGILGLGVVGIKLRKYA